MALTLSVIRENDLRTSSFEFYPGEDIQMKLQVYESQNDQFFHIPEEWTVEVTLPATPTEIAIPNTSVIRSCQEDFIFYVPVTNVVTPRLLSGNIVLTITECIPFISDGTAGGSFTVNSISNLSEDSSIILRTNTLTYTGEIFSIVGVEAPYTVQLLGAPDLSLYTVALNARITQKVHLAVLRNGLKKRVSSV